MSRPAKYKPLLWTTTLRNPERLKNFLSILKKYDGKILNNKLAEKVSKEVIKSGLYRPTKMSLEIKKKIKEKKITSLELSKILVNNPQNHKEAGFDRGWPSRFDTWFKIAKEWGFVFYRNNEKIKFSDIGLKLADTNSHHQFEQTAFLNAFVKYQRNNPFRKVLNKNKPLILLLQVIKKINADRSLNNAGISRLELPLLIYWKDNNAEALYNRIKKLRKQYRLSPSGEVIFDICQNEIMEGEYIKRDHKSIIVDYPDEFIRKMRLTGLISLRANGRFIDINKNEEKKIRYILKNYSKYKKYNTEEEYFYYVSKLDKKLIAFEPKPTLSAKREIFLKKWLAFYSWKTIKSEILKLTKSHLTTDEILKYLPNPVRLEFLSALAIKSKFPNVQVIPNYPVDDEGLPTSTAGGIGDKGDIECFEQKNGILVEVTMLQGAIQTKMEVYPVVRHLEKFKEKTGVAICYFVAPSVFIDSKRKIEFVKKHENLFVYPKTIEEFVNYLENNNYLYTSC